MSIDSDGPGSGHEPNRSHRARFARAVTSAMALLGASTDVEDGLAEVARLLVPAGADWCAIDLLEPNGGPRLVAVGRPSSPEPASERILWRLAASGESLLVPAPRRRRSDEGASLLAALGSTSLLAVPLFLRGEVGGAMLLGRVGDTPAFRTADLHLAETLARFLMLVLDRARLTNESRAMTERAGRADDRLRRLEALTAAVTPDEVAQVVVDLGADAFGAAACVLVVPREDERVLEIVRVIGYPEEETAQWRRMPMDAPAPLAEAARTGATVWVESPAARQSRFPSLGPTSGLHAAWASVPLVAEGRVVGVLGLSFQQARTHDDGEWELLTAVAQQAALALERARLYEATEQAHAAARDALRTRDDFISLAAHELRTPITSLRAFATLLERRLRDERLVDLGAVRLGIAAIDRQTIRLTTLVAQLLDVARLEGGQLAMTRTRTDLAALTQEIVEQHRVIVPSHEMVVTAPEPILADVDALHLEQVIANLVGNAAKFSPVGTAIEVEVARSDDAWATISVRDHGPGVPPAMRDRIFERYVRQGGTDNPSGLGLGLFISREIARLHGGDVTVEEAEGGGACFVVRLPLPAND
jgi:K+-sensing histidine kinase KdpD